MQGRRVQASVMRGNDHDDVVRRGLGVFDKDVEIPVLIEQAGVDQFKFWRMLRPCGVALAQLRVWIFPLRVLVEHFEISVRRRRIEVIVILFHVLAVIALGTSQTEKPFLQVRITFIP